MALYPKLASLVSGASGAAAATTFDQQVVPYLVQVWLDDYTQASASNDIVETTTDGFSYLFDVQRGRLIAAWGISRGRHSGARDKARMAGHPLSNGALYHRGHAIPHTLGGPTDINLVPQLGAVNIGPFRALERQVVATPGALYFTYWLYGGANSQTPSGVEQGLLVPGAAPDIRRHAN